jgi:DNA-binding IclR family transcriptional regulator
VRESEVAEREEIAGWLSGGESMARIAKEMSIPYSRVRRIAAELKAEGMVVERRSRRLTINDEATINEVWDE